MSRDSTNSSSIIDRIFAAIFSGAAAGMTYAIWLFFHSSEWGTIQKESIKEIGVCIALGGAVIGFFGGLDFVTKLWGGIWETSNQPLFSLRTAVFIVFLGAIAYGAYKLFVQ